MENRRFLHPLAEVEVTVAVGEASKNRRNYQVSRDGARSIDGSNGLFQRDVFD